MESLARIINSGHHTYTEFRKQPAVTNVLGAAADGTTGAVNMWQMERTTFEQHIKGTQTIIAPVIAAGGLNVGLDQTSGDGLELTEGITTRCPVGILTGTGAGFLKAKFSIGTVAGTAVCVLGFRRAASYGTAYTGYTEYAGLNVNVGEVNSVTRKASGSAVVTDSLVAWADGETHTLAVYVDTTGAVTYKVDGVNPLNTATPPVPVLPAFTFTAGITVVPFFFLLQNSTTTGALLMQSYECGHLAEQL